MDLGGDGVTIAVIDIVEGEENSPRLDQAPAEEGSKGSVFELQKNEAYAAYLS